jgi:hypothetical protein
VDSGFKQEKRYLAPYRNSRHRLDNFEGTSEHALSNHENFNLAHSKIHNVVEWTFGLLKERWTILGGVPYFPIDKQKKIILACFVLNNYLWEWEHGDGSTARYKLSDWVAVSSTSNMSLLRELIIVRIYYAN